MNVLVAFLTANWQRFELERFGSPHRLSCVIGTPRFRASSHVLFFVLAGDVPAPILVVKMPRLPCDNGPLHREASNLRRLQASRPQGFDSVPRVVAYEEYANRAVLVETGLEGHPIDLRARQAVPGIERVIDWLVDVHTATLRPSSTVAGWYQRTALDPLEVLARMAGSGPIERELIDRTAMLADTIRESELPLVFEHGDFSPPNILVLRDGEVGVVDWEMADPQGLPGSDLFLFLTVAAFARDRAHDERGYLSSFHRAFFGASAWARPYITRYARRVGLSHHLLVPLFVLCWSRYVTALGGRLQHVARSDGSLATRTAEWLHSNRHYSLWKHTVAHYDDLKLS